MEYGGAGADQGRSRQQHQETVGTRQQQKPDEGDSHPDRQRIGLRPVVGYHTDHRLQQRRGHLHRQRDQPDLRKAEAIGVLQHRIQRRHQRLHRVVQEMREAQRQDNREGGAFHDRAAVSALFGHAGGHQLISNDKLHKDINNPPAARLRINRVCGAAWQPFGAQLFGNRSRLAECPSEGVERYADRAAQDRLIGMQREFRRVG